MVLPVAVISTIPLGLLPCGMVNQARGDTEPMLVPHHNVDQINLLKMELLLLLTRSGSVQLPRSRMLKRNGQPDLKATMLAMRKASQKVTPILSYQLTQMRTQNEHLFQD